MIWSGLNKYLQTMAHQHAKAVEIPNLGVIGPYVEKWATMKDPLDKGPITKSTYSVKDPSVPRTDILALREDFVTSAGISLDQRPDRAVACYDPAFKDELNELFTKISGVNTSSLASVCLTDVTTVDLMLQEFIARLQQESKTTALKINFKVGTLHVKSGVASWQ